MLYEVESPLIAWSSPNIKDIEPRLFHLYSVGVSVHVLMIATALMIK